MTGLLVQMLQSYFKWDGTLLLTPVLKVLLSSQTINMSGASSVSGGKTLDKTLCLQIISLVLGKQMSFQSTGQEMRIA
jgi:hypothetical protein